MKFNFEKYNTQGWQGRDDYLSLNTRNIYIPNYTLIKLLKDIECVDIFYDKENKVIQLVPNSEGIKIGRFKKQAHISTSLARVMPKGWYLWKENLIFQFTKAKVK